MQYQVDTFRRKSPFVNKVRHIMRLAHLSPRTEDAYVRVIVDFFAWHRFKHPDTIVTQDVTDYLSMMASERKVAASTQNQAFNALLFLFRRVLEREFGQVRAQRAAAAKNVPEFLSKDEINAVLKQLQGEHHTLALLAYGSGMRLMELLRLRVKDMDFTNSLIVVKQGKGRKDRLVPLPKSMVNVLKAQVSKVAAQHAQDVANGFGEVFLPDGLARKYPKAAKELKWQYVFPSPTICHDKRTGLRGRHHLFETGFQRALKVAGDKAGLNKRVHPHILRHSFATHCLEMGMNLEQLRDVMGHKDVTTTQIYTHCVDIRKVRSPADCLCEH